MSILFYLFKFLLEVRKFVYVQCSELRLNIKSVRAVLVAVLFTNRCTCLPNNELEIAVIKFLVHCVTSVL